MPPNESKPKSAAAGYAQNRRNCGQAAMLDLHETIPGEYWDQTLSSADYSGEGRAMMAAKAYITALKAIESKTSSVAPTAAPGPASLTESPAYRQLIATFTRATQFVAGIVSQRGGEVSVAVTTKIEQINDLLVEVCDNLVQEEMDLVEAGGEGRDDVVWEEERLDPEGQ